MLVVPQPLHGVVPNVVGLDLRRARAKLGAVKARHGRRVDGRRVLAQGPRPGRRRRSRTPASRPRRADVTLGSPRPSKRPRLEEARAREAVAPRALGRLRDADARAARRSPARARARELERRLVEREAVVLARDRRAPGRGARARRRAGGRRRRRAARASRRARASARARGSARRSPRRRPRRRS